MNPEITETSVENKTIFTDIHYFCRDCRGPEGGPYRAICGTVKSIAKFSPTMPATCVVCIDLENTHQCFS